MEEIFVSTVAELPIWMMVSLGFYLAYRGLKFPDLTVDVSFLAGMAATGCAAITWESSLAGLFLAIVLGATAGAITTLIYLTNPRPAYKLLAGLLVVFGYYSVNYRVLGHRTYAVLTQQHTFMNALTDYEKSVGWESIGVISLAIGFGLLAAQVCALAWFLRTRLGLAIRAVGSNPRVVRSSSGAKGLYLLLGLAMSNTIVALGGWLYASLNKTANIAVFGTVIHALAAAIIGEVLVERMPKIKDRRSSAWALLLAPLIGAMIYQTVRACIMYAVCHEYMSVDRSTYSISQQDINTLVAVGIIVVVIGVRFLAMRSRLELAADESD